MHCVHVFACARIFTRVGRCRGGFSLQAFGFLHQLLQTPEAIRRPPAQMWWRAGSWQARSYQRWGCRLRSIGLSSWAAADKTYCKKVKTYLETYHRWILNPLPRMGSIFDALVMWVTLIGPPWKGCWPNKAAILSRRLSLHSQDRWNKTALGYQNHKNIRDSRPQLQIVYVFLQIHAARKGMAPVVTHWLIPGLSQLFILFMMMITMMINYWNKKGSVMMIMMMRFCWYLHFFYFRLFCLSSSYHCFPLLIIAHHINDYLPSSY